MKAIPYERAILRYREGTPDDPEPIGSGGELVARFHPDRAGGATTKLLVGSSRGDACERSVAQLLQSNSLIDDADLAGSEVVETDVAIVGGGGAGCAAAIAANDAGARVLVVNKLRLGDSNTVMAEGGMQAAIDPADSPQLHFDDTMRAGHFAGDPDLVERMVMDGPAIVQWLIRLGMRFDLETDHPFGDLTLKRPGGASAARIVAYGDTTGLEMMRVLRAEVNGNPEIDVWSNHPVVELLSDGSGRCTGVVAYDVRARRFVLVRANAVILATGGIGRVHLNGFTTSNHFGATGDGLVLAYRMGAPVCDLDSYQYHPTGLAHPPHLAGALITEAVRSAGAHLRNGEGRRFVDELGPRDAVSAAIIAECEEGRGIERDGRIGVWLDTPGLAAREPGVLEGFSALRHLADKCGLDPAEEAFLVAPTLHYQNGGVRIDEHGRTPVEGLYCAGEVAGGVHGRNRLMGNALLEILSFGRRAGADAAHAPRRAERAGLEHVAEWRRALTSAGLPLDRTSPQLYPVGANFDLATHRAESA